MLQRLTFKNIGCLRDVQVDLAPLTALVGPNAAGKTTMVRALDPKFRLRSGNTWQHDGSLKQVLSLRTQDGREQHQVRNASTGGPEFSGTSLARRYQSLVLDVERLRQQNTVGAETLLGRQGGNLTNVFATLSRKTQISVSEELCKLVPVLADVEARPTQAGHHTLVFQDRWNEEAWYLPEEVSDGTMFLLAFLVLQHQKEPPDLLAIEEPDRGLHPYLLEQVVSLLRGLTTGDIGPRPIQVIITTHSAELLDLLQPEEVRFMEREDDGSVVVQAPPTEEEAFREAMEAYQNALGAAWLSGGLGGVPG